MNFVDGIISVVAPVWGLRRVRARRALEVFNTGYSEGGASRSKSYAKGYTARSADSVSDIDMNLGVLRNRSRDMFMNAPLGRSAIMTARTNIVGQGLKLKSRIDYEFLGLSDSRAEEFERCVERDFALWAESVFCDSTRTNNFYELQQLAQLSWLASGDCFALLKREKPSAFMPYGLRVHLLEADRVCTPEVFYGSCRAVNPDNGNRIISGVEIDENGAAVAYWVACRHPLASFEVEPLSWNRVEAFGELTGRRNILHLMESERPEQRRGVPFLSPVIETLKQLTRYTYAELMNAVVSSMFCAFIKTDATSGQFPVEKMVSAEQSVTRDVNEYEMAAGAINPLNPGEDIVFANPTHPSTGFDAYVTAVTRYVGAALEIPQELLLKAFNSSYSAARASLLEAWKMFKMRRSWLTNDFCQPIYEEWLAEAVAHGRISAPGFFKNPLIRKAYCNAEWNGPAPGQIDPSKEVAAASLRIENGLSTREQETQQLTGGDFDANIRQLAREKELMKGVVIEDGQDQNGEK